MVKCKHKKRLRRKTKFRKTLGKNTDSKNHDEESNASVQRSPETVLFESPHADLLCNEKISPEIISKQSKIRLLRAKACEDDAEFEDEIVVRKIELSNPSSLKRHASNPKYDCKHDIKSTNDFPHLEDYLKRDIDRLIVDSADCCSSHSLILKKEPSNANFDEKNSGGSPEERSQQRDRYKSETMNDCYSLDKTLSINDDLVCQMNNYLEKQSSAIIASHFTVKKSSSIADLQSESLDKFIFARSSVGESERNDGLRDKDKSKKHRSNKRFDAETFGERLITNWHELGNIFSYLWRITKRIRSQDTKPGTSFLTKYKKFIDDRWRSCTFITTLSSLSSESTLLAPSSLSSDANENPITYQSLLAKEDRESEESYLETENAEYFGIQSGSTTPCSGSPPPAKRCRTTLTFEDEKVEEQRQPATRAEITSDPFFKKGRKNEDFSFPLNLPSCEETPHISESIFFLSDVDPFAMPDYDNCENALQQVTPSIFEIFCSQKI